MDLITFIIEKWPRFSTKISQISREIFLKEKSGVGRNMEKEEKSGDLLTNREICSLCGLYGAYW